MNNVKLDRNYNIEIEDTQYETEFMESVDVIIKAKESGLIKASEASFLIKLVTKKEIGQIAKKSFLSAGNKTEVHSLFMNLRSNRVNHA